MNGIKAFVIVLLSYGFVAQVVAESPVRFLALGDAGEGNAAQYQNGIAMQ